MVWTYLHRAARGRLSAESEGAGSLQTLESGTMQSPAKPPEFGETTTCFCRELIVCKFILLLPGHNNTTHGAAQRVTSWARLLFLGFDFANRLVCHSGDPLTLPIRTIFLVFTQRDIN